MVRFTSLVLAVLVRHASFCHHTAIAAAATDARVVDDASSTPSLSLFHDHEGTSNLRSRSSSSDRESKAKVKEEHFPVYYVDDDQEIVIDEDDTNVPPPPVGVVDDAHGKKNAGTNKVGVTRNISPSDIINQVEHSSTSTAVDGNLYRPPKPTGNSNMIDCVYTEAHAFSVTKTNTIKHDTYCVTDAGVLYLLKGIEDHDAHHLMKSSHTRLSIPSNALGEDSTLNLLGRAADVSITNGHQDLKQELTSTKGTFKVLVVLVTDRFGNRPSQSEAQMYNDVFADAINLKERFRACSKNQLIYTPATGTGVNNGVITVQVNTNLNGLPASDCLQFGKSSIPSGISADKYMFVCPDSVDFDGGRAAAFGLIGGSDSWYQSKYASYADVQVHELGHNLGFLHSGGDDGETYTDGVCHMGNKGGYKDESKKFCFNAAKTYYSSWFPEYYTTVTPTSANFKGELVGIDDVVNDRAGNNHKLVVKINGGGESDLFMMYNRKKGVISEVPEEADRIHIVSQSSSSENSRKVGSLSAGQTYTKSNWANSGKNLKIKVCSASTSGSAPDVASVIVYLEGVNDLFCGPNPGCTDSPVGWHDSDGSTYNCAWYAEGSNCDNYGNGLANQGKTAKQACCACGGGCVDEHTRCGYWADRRYCSWYSKYAPYMRLNCKKSCNLCG